MAASTGFWGAVGAGLFNVATDYMKKDKGGGQGSIYGKIQAHSSMVGNMRRASSLRPDAMPAPRKGVTPMQFPGLDKAIARIGLDKLHQHHVTYTQQEAKRKFSVGKHTVNPSTYGFS